MQRAAEEVMEKNLAAFDKDKQKEVLAAAIAAAKKSKKKLTGRDIHHDGESPRITRRCSTLARAKFVRWWVAGNLKNLNLIV